MTLTVSENVVIRILNSAAMIYSDLPAERPGEAAEFRAALDLAIAVIRARPVHRAASQTTLKLIPGKARKIERKGPASGATLPSHGSAERKTA